MNKPCSPLPRTSSEVLTQSISALKSTASTLERDVAELDNTLAGQKEEFAELEKTLAEVNDILKDLGPEVDLDSLPEKIEQIEDGQENPRGKTGRA